MILQALPGGGVASVIHMKTMHLGPDELPVGARIAVSATATGAEIARAIDAAERPVRLAVPIARVVYLEPDMLRTGSTRSASQATGTRTTTDDV